VTIDKRATGDGTIAAITIPGRAAM